ncbi:TPA: hypothetical protein IAA87_04965 [Candidatus Avigastranaerophilus faecigallinarum]|nr:hypothetical protein [Candidatus Avigastranaerophilus faecigallinarum]
MKQQSNTLEKILLWTYFIWGFVLQYVYTVNINVPFRQSLLALVNGLAILVYLFYIIIYFAERVSNVYLPGLIGVGVFLVLGLIYSRHQIGIAYVASFLLIVCAGTIPFKKILKVFIYFSSITLISTILLNLLKIIPSMIIFSDERIRNSLGFYYVSFASAIMFFYVCAYIVYRGKEITYKELVFLLLGDVFIFSYTRTNNPFLLSVVFIIYMFLYKITDKKILTHFKICKVIVSLIFPISFFSLLWLLEKAPISLFNQINKLASYRLSFSVRAINNYGIRPLGQKIEMITKDGLGGFGGSNYNYIDSFYIQNLVINGWIFIAIVLIGYTIIAVRAIKQQKEILTMALILLALHAIFDPQLFWAWYSPFSLLLGQLFFKKRDNKLLI